MDRLSAPHEQPRREQRDQHRGAHQDGRKDQVRNSRADAFRHPSFLESGGRCVRRHILGVCREQLLLFRLQRGPSGRIVGSLRLCRRRRVLSGLDRVAQLRYRGRRVLLRGRRVGQLLLLLMLAVRVAREGSVGGGLHDAAVLQGSLVVHASPFRVIGMSTGIIVLSCKHGKQKGCIVQMWATGIVVALFIFVAVLFLVFISCSSSGKEPFDELTQAGARAADPARCTINNYTFQAEGLIQHPLSTSDCVIVGKGLGLLSADDPINCPTVADDPSNNWTNPLNHLVKPINSQYIGGLNRCVLPMDATSSPDDLVSLDQSIMLAGAEVRTNMPNVQKALKDTTSSLSTANTALTDAANNAQALAGQFSTLSTALTNAMNHEQAMEMQLSALASQDENTMKNQVNILTTEDNNLTAKVSTLQNQVKNSSSNDSSLSADVTSLQNQLKDYSSKNRSLNAELKNQLTISSLSSAGPVTSLSVGQFIQSPNGKFCFTLQSDGNAVVYKTSYYSLPSDLAARAPFATFATNTAGTNAASIVMQNDGNLVIYDSNKKPLWACCIKSPGMPDGTSMVHRGGGGTAPFNLQMQDDGNLVVYDATISPKWAIIWN
ncbi:hypothetical protein CEUSTIGMA_g11940.t1 [Chlamydomonas eustigma]|uniref:Bulb-type lectin domain-containing protein n=1 Tax=Chlamydomonas eustigma TaxID=1157962 RepID=A0A250XNZ7_9CHLO|nr:hypothetical protein CEUSTIGMA_g11940.t1 [Chlamydomonas eustigma]|eukprot:GAX84520.1 hypothetical protein CEUSTIGMA_g11940.t1 [Chlamydomonas eustigma]